MTLPCSFYFLRHGQTRWNNDKRLQGYIDVPLNSAGLQQAVAAAPLVGKLPVEQVVTSDLFRARRTAQLACAELPHIPHYIYGKLRERCFGDWEGELVDPKLLKLNPDGVPHLPKSVNPPRGETWEVFKQRSMDALEVVLKEHGENTLVVAHGYVFVAVVQALLGEDFMSDNCIPYLFEKRPKHKWVLHNLRRSSK